MTSAARSLVPVIATMLFVALPACGAIEEMAQRLDGATAAAPPPAPKVKPLRATPPPPRPKPEIARAAVRTIGRDIHRPARAEPDPELLIGLKPAQAIAALGNPATVVERSPSMVWRYNVGACALDLFFYMDLGANAFRVLAYDMKAGDMKAGDMKAGTSSDGAHRACLGRFRAAADGR